MPEPIPYSRQCITDADIAAVTAVLRAPFLTQGPAIAAFEQAVASVHDMQHGVAVTNATCALHIACLALGVGPGKRVWTVPNSFVASANCARYCGATVDFVDIDPVSRTISIAELERKLADAGDQLPDVVIPVDFAGYPCDLVELRALADRYGFKILSDSSHAVGARYQGKPIGHLADITVFSFHPVKIVTTGEGGMCLTNDPALADAMIRLRSHGITRDPQRFEGKADGPWYYEQVELGFNYRMTDIQAALGTSQVQNLPERAAQREALARRYDSELDGLPLFLPPRSNDRQSAHHLYVIEIDEARTDISRLAVYNHLRADGIMSNVHYIPIHLQPDYHALGFASGDFPVSEKYYRRALSIPLFPALEDSEFTRVVASLRRVLS